MTKTYLLALGWWNLIGCGLMLGFFHEGFGKKMLNEWTKIFAVPYTLDYWSKFWLAWAVGLNIFFALVNILSVHWDFEPLMKLSLVTDLVAYSLFIGLAIWGMVAKRTGSGIYTVFIVFGIWLVWGTLALVQG